MGAKPPRLKINRVETTRGERLGGETSCYQVRLMKKKYSNVMNAPKGFGLASDTFEEIYL